MEASANPFTPSQATLMIKPVGAACNLRCTYCYYLPTMALYNGRERRMSLETLERVFAGYLPHAGPQVTIAWQGGEPTLAGLAFFKHAVELQKKHARPNQAIGNALQTNGTLLDEAWCRFLAEYRFLVGLSLDGPTRFHDAYRHDTRGEGSSDRVLTTLDLLRRYGVEFNILCVLTGRNVGHPDELLGFFLNRGIHWLQFIPAVEWEEEPADQPPRLASFSPSSEAYGRFLCRLFDLWFERYRHYVSIRFFDSVIAKMVMDEMPLCILGGSCHTQLTIEHDGSVFGCDHFVEPRWRLGQVDGVDWMARLDQPRLTRFAQGKQRVPPTCLACPWYRFCYGGCPKHRPHRGDEAHAPAASVLCEGYRAFYAHAMPRLEWLCGYLRQNRLPPPPQQTPSAAPRSVKPGRFAPQEQVVPMRVPRNAPCPCGSGRKFKRCHGAGWR